QLALVDHREPRRVVAPVLEAPQARDENGRRLLSTDVTDDAAHGLVRAPCSLLRAQHLAPRVGPARLVHLRRARERERVSWHVLGDGGPGSYERAVADLH